MKRAVVPAVAAVAVAAVVLVAFALADHVARARAVARSQSPTGAPPQRRQDMPADGMSIPCALVNSGFAVAGHPDGNSVPGRCTVTAVSTTGNGKIVLHWPGGHGTRPVTTTYVLGRPAK